MTIKELIGQSFAFKASHYFEWHGERCTRRGFVNSIIRAHVTDEAVTFHIAGNESVRIAPDFSMKHAGQPEQADEWIRYGHIPKVKPYGLSPQKPVACHVSPSLERIQFVTLSPFRRIEYQGHFML